MDIGAAAFTNQIFDAFGATSESRYIFVANMWTDVSRWSKNAVDYFGLPGEYMEGAGAIWEQHIHPEDRKVYRDDIDLVFSGKKKKHDIEYRVRDKEGRYVLVSCRAVVIDDEEGNPSFFAGTITNHGIQDNVDPTTNLYNLYEFLHELKKLREQRIDAKVLLIGFRHFSNINNVYGYHFGNEVMRCFGVELRELVKGRGSLFRMDGTRFAVVSTSMSIDEIKELYQTVQDVIRKGIVVEGIHVNMDSCGGAVIVEDHNVSEQTIHASARYALESSKNEKHGELVVVYNDSADQNKKTLALINELRNCIINNCEGFYMCYQPVVDADTGKLMGMEALLRWKKEPYGEVSPAIFIPWLEKDAVFFDLGNWILKTVMEDGKEFLKDHPDITVNVNISYTQLERSEFRSKIVSMLANTGFPSEHLCLELTERCSFLDMDLLRNETDFLKSYGIKIALDDFGTGFASLNLLRTLQVDCIKIDREFIREIETNPIDQTIVKAVTQCANELNVPVCVEGIENDALMEYMHQYHVREYQGYFFSKPVEKEEFKQLDCYRKVS